MLSNLLSMQTLLILVGLFVVVPLSLMLLRSAFTHSSSDSMMHDVAGRLALLEQSHLLYMASLNRPLPDTAASNLRYDDWLQFKRGLLESKSSLAHAYHMIIELEKHIDRWQPKVATPEQTVPPSTTATTSSSSTSSSSSSSSNNNSNSPHNAEPPASLTEQVIQ
jgi:hypothetical protein